jgi:hypothetical protein
MRFDVLTKLPEETLPEADQCLLKQIGRLGASQENFAQFELTQKTRLAGRFATKVISRRCWPFTSNTGIRVQQLVGLRLEQCTPPPRLAHLPSKP